MALDDAALLAKTDLTAELVKEFTELQGVVGGLYARAQGFPGAVGDAIYDQYKPVSMEDSVPRRLRERCWRLRIRSIRLRGCLVSGWSPRGRRILSRYAGLLMGS